MGKSKVALWERFHFSHRRLLFLPVERSHEFRLTKRRAEGGRQPNVPFEDGKVVLLDFLVGLGLA